MSNKQNWQLGSLLKCSLLSAALMASGTVVTAAAAATTSTKPAAASAASAATAKQGGSKSLTLTGNQFSYQLFNGRWRDNIAEWSYNPLWQTGGLTTEQMLVSIARAALKWSDVCNIKFRYNGLTQAIPDIFTTNYNQIDGISTIGWLPFGTSLAGADAYTLFWYANYRGNDYIDDADLALNIYAQPTFSPERLADLDGLLTQQLGYFIGIAPSDNPTSILFTQPFHTYNYMQTLRGDDVEACVAVYGATPLTNINRIFNWGEVTFPELLSPPGRLTQQLSGFNYRYFEDTGIYVGEMDGVIYYMLPGGAITPFGTVADLLPIAVAAGF